MINVWLMLFNAKHYWFQQGLVIIGAKHSKEQYVEWCRMMQDGLREDFEINRVVEYNVGDVGMVGNGLEW